MRGKVIDAGKNAGINIAQTRLRRDDLTGADGVFVTNAIMGITPVARLAFNDGAASSEQTFKDFSVSRRLRDLISH
jgi:branched-subunit amino acid aminotransferase/4-amino-4-deoxychorismate lyase